MSIHPVSTETTPMRDLAAAYLAADGDVSSTRVPEAISADFDEDEEGCGYSWDHTLDEGETVDGVTVQTCRECGAEIVTDEEAP